MLSGVDRVHDRRVVRVLGREVVARVDVDDDRDEPVRAGEGDGVVVDTGGQFVGSANVAGRRTGGPLVRQTRTGSGAMSLGLRSITSPVGALASTIWYRSDCSVTGCWCAGSGSPACVPQPSRTVVLLSGTRVRIELGDEDTGLVVVVDGDLDVPHDRALEALLGLVGVAGRLDDRVAGGDDAQALGTAVIDRLQEHVLRGAEFLPSKASTIERFETYIFGPLRVIWRRKSAGLVAIMGSWRPGTCRRRCRPVVRRGRCPRSDGCSDCGG